MKRSDAGAKSAGGAGYTSPYDFRGRIPLQQAVPLGLQHVLAMFVGNLTPLMIICGICGITGMQELYVTLLQNAMLAAGIITLIQLWSIGPIGGQVPVIMGTSSGFLGVMRGVAAATGGLAGYSAILGATMIGGCCEAVLGFFIKPLRKFFPPVAAGPAGAGGDRRPQALYQGDHLHLLHPLRDYCGLHRGHGHGLCHAPHPGVRGQRRLVRQLGQNRGGRLVRRPQDPPHQAHL